MSTIDYQVFHQVNKSLKMQYPHSINKSGYDFELKFDPLASTPKQKRRKTEKEIFSGLTPHGILK